MLASATSALLNNGWLDDLNPVTTAGSIEVRVAFAKTVDGFMKLAPGEGVFLGGYVCEEDTTDCFSLTTRLGAIRSVQGRPKRAVRLVSGL